MLEMISSNCLESLSHTSIKNERRIMISMGWDGSRFCQTQLTPHLISKSNPSKKWVPARKPNLVGKNYDNKWQQMQ